MVDKLTIVVDTREQTPYEFVSFENITLIRDTLSIGDYTLANPNLRDVCSVERKSINDFVMCVGRERSRFERELRALRGYRYKLVLCEFSYNDIIYKRYNSKVVPHAVTGSIARWTSTYSLPFILAGDRVNAEAFLVQYFNLIKKEVFEYCKSLVLI